MHVLLVNPACLDHRITDADALAMPMGLYYLGALLKEKGIEVTLANLAGVPDPLARLSELLETHHPRIVGFSLLNAGRHCAVDGAALARKTTPGVTVVFGGPGATFLGASLFDACPALDIIVKGEGERSFAGLVDHIHANKTDLPLDIQGLMVRSGTTIVDTGGPLLVEDLDALPHPSAYFTFQHISLSRGCPGRCRFCGSPAFWGTARVRFHSPEWFVDEMEQLLHRGVTHFFISDDTFTMDRERVIAVCRLMISRGLDCTWVAISRVDFLDEEMLILMRRAGCIQISFGVESGSEDIRRNLGKPVKEARIVKAFEMTRSLGILPRAYIIYGSPGETGTTIQESVDLMHRIKPLSLIAYMLVLFPGTGLYMDLLSRGLISDAVWEQPIEDIPWFQLDPHLDMDAVVKFGKKIRNTFFSHVQQYALDVELKDDKQLYPLHADFLSRLAMTFSHGDYSNHPRVKNPLHTAEILFKRALSHAPHVRGFLGLGMVYQKKREFSKAVSLLGTALETYPGDKDLNVCMAVSLMNLGRFAEALSCLEKFKGDQNITRYIDICRSREA